VPPTPAAANARRRRGAAATQRGYRDEYMTLDDTPDGNSAAPPPRPVTIAASGNGAGTLGLSGATAEPDAAAGLATLASDGYGNGPTEPMLPADWKAKTD